MFHNISNPKWFGNWSRLEDDYLGNGGTDIADNFTFSKMEKTGGLFGSIIRLATAFPACDPETGHAAEAPTGTRWVPNDAPDYGFDDDDDDIPAFSFPEA